MIKLKKELGLLELTLYGIGIILGAGIYSLLGVGAGLAGNMTWAVFLIGAFIATFTGLSYAELSTMFQKEAAEYNYTKHAFRKEILAFLVGWVILIAGIVSAAVVALAFGGYLANLIGGSAVFYALALIVALSVLNYIGIKESTKFNNFATVIEAGGLILVIIIGFLFSGNVVPDINLLELPATGFAGILTAVGVIFFAFTGFEAIANVSEEVKSKNLLPKAIVISLIVSTLLYILLSLAILKLATWQELASSSAPLTLAVGKVLPGIAFMISIIALFATSNTVLIMLIAASRILYGMSSQHSFPKYFSRISSRGTPYLAIITIGIIAAIATAYGNIRAVAELTDIGLFIVYFFVNASLITLHLSGKKGKFAGPSIGKIPIFAVMGALSSLAMLFYFRTDIWLVQIMIIILGLLVFVLKGK
jgi:APA family basic amino acid/polyamine antiporter